MSWDQFVPVGSFATIRMRAMGEWLWSTRDLLDNELMRLGGFQNFRGFPEKLFLADIFGMGTFEYRFYLGLKVMSMSFQILELYVIRKKISQLIFHIVWE